ncbi:DUF962 domain-containing protein [Piscinibacter sakaiensis]|uniref:Putative transmembrane protein n=1 Tax=Piscinibacter sakaiensis TaxID=1547922 RepID=A0A0K8P022_PISS1|nr:DUF962 domain-containing protein [Piscinibacter sakaiensis]GAP35981.1 putative transmembrane protein [Piscinibacter sakaiensis]
MPTADSAPRFRSFAEFYPFYLGEHRHPTSRRLHVVGTSLAVVLIATAAWTGRPGWLLLALLQGYAFAWVGHFFFEHNRPATFRHPLYSFLGDWRMWWEVVSGRRPF